MGPCSLTEAEAFHQRAVSCAAEDWAAELHDGVWEAREAPAQKKRKKQDEQSVRVVCLV